MLLCLVQGGRFRRVDTALIAGIDTQLLRGGGRGHGVAYFGDFCFVFTHDV